MQRDAAGPSIASIDNLFWNGELSAQKRTLRRENFTGIWDMHAAERGSAYSEQ